MQNIQELLDSVIREQRPEMSREERGARFRLLMHLFTFYRQAREPDAEARLDVYLGETAHVPFEFLALGVKLVLRAHPYPSLPSVADLLSAARTVAGMNREQYKAGRYLPPPRDWPPRGQRHAIEAGKLEPMATDVEGLIEAHQRTQLGPGDEAA